MYIQDLNQAVPKIHKHFTQYPEASISAIYRQLRNLSYLSFFGDYPILSAITNTVFGMGISVKRSSVQRAMRYSEELKGQRVLLDQLSNHQLTLWKDAKMPYNERNSAKTSNSSSMGVKAL